MNLLKYFMFQHGTFKINILFGRHVLRLALYYGRNVLCYFIFSCRLPYEEVTLSPTNGVGHKR